MHCDCCDNLLSPSEISSRFYDADPDASVRYTNMCSKCLDELHPSIRVVTRPGVIEDDDTVLDPPELDHEVEFNDFKDYNDYEE